jgi:hypothetical protein
MKNLARKSAARPPVAAVCDRRSEGAAPFAPTPAAQPPHSAQSSISKLLSSGAQAQLSVLSQFALGVFWLLNRAQSFVLGCGAAKQNLQKSYSRAIFSFNYPRKSFKF